MEPQQQHNQEKAVATRQASPTTTSPASPTTSLATYSRDTAITPAMLTPAFIREATRAVTNPRTSVELAKSGQLYVPTVRKIVKELGDQRMEALIKAELVTLNVMLNLARPMTEPMIEGTAPLVVQHILEDDCDITLADLRIIFDRAKKGTYGSFYGGIGSADIIAWIDGYIAEKCSEYERWHQNEYQRLDPYERGSSDTKAERNAFHEALAKYTQARLTQGQNAEQ